MYSLLNERKLIWKLSKNDFKTKYAGSYLGIIWGFVQPIVTVVVYWIVFEYGLRVGTPIENTPYVLWFITGMIPWLFFAEALSTATNSFLEYNYLVKKMVFNVSVLPVVKIMSAVFVHLVFLGIASIVYLFFGRFFKIDFFQLIYFFVAMLVFLTALVYIAAPLQVFVKDLGQFINVSLQIFMWATPILWNYDIVPEKYLWIVQLNPMFYIVNGYRGAFLHTDKFWLHPVQTVYFWGLTGALFIIGHNVFKRLYPHFADML